MVVAQGASKVTILIEMIEDRDDARLPALAREAVGSLVEQLRMAQTQILDLEKQLKAWHRTNEASRRLEAIPGVGVITATALVATIGDASQFHSGRQLAAWLGLVPYSSGGTNEASRRLEAIPGVGVITATALVATIGDASQFLGLRASTCRLAGPGSKTVFQRRTQGAARAHIQARRRLSPSPFSSWRARRSALV